MPKGGSNRKLSFDGFVLDQRARTLYHHGREVDLRAKCFDVLVCLVSDPGTLLTREQLLDQVWKDITVSDESLSRCISDIRAALGDEYHTMIRTLPSRGYQFTADVDEISEPSFPIPAMASRWRVAVPVIVIIAVSMIIGLIIHRTGDTQFTGSSVSRDPSIAVLPFENTSGNAEIEPFVAGLTSDLNSALARIPDLLVITQNSARTFAESGAGIRAVAEKLGVNHVLVGSVQRENGRLRVSAQLVDADTAAVVWSGRYDRQISDFLSLQDDIVKNVLTELQVELTHGETARLASAGTDDLDAWLANNEGLSEGFQFTRENNFKARDLFSKAAGHDPQWAAPIGGLAWTYREALRRGWSDDPDRDRMIWKRLAEQCMDIDPGFSGCYIQLGNYHIENGEIGRGLELREKALALAPNDLSALSGLAWQLILTGQVERGLELIQRAKRVSPVVPGWLLATEAFGYQEAGRLELAADGFRNALSSAEFPDWHARLAAVYVEMGEMENARRQARIFLQKRPERTVSDLIQILKIQTTEKRDEYASLLRAAGIRD